MIFTTGYTRQLMLPFALTITYALVASLLVSLTVVPTMGSLMLRRAKPKAHPWFDKVLGVYGSVLRFCLRVKAVPILVSVLLLAFSVIQVARIDVYKRQNRDRPLVSLLWANPLTAAAQELMGAMMHTGAAVASIR